MLKEKNREINKVLRISKNHKNFTFTFLKIFHLFWGKNWQKLIESKNSESTSIKKSKKWGKKKTRTLEQDAESKKPRPDMHSRLTSFSFIYSNFFFFFSLSFFSFSFFLFTFYSCIIQMTISFPPYQSELFFTTNWSV